MPGVDDDLSHARRPKAKLAQSVVANVTGASLASTNALLAAAFPMATSWSYAAASGGILNTTVAVTIKAADALLRNYIVSIQIDAEALGTATELAIRDGAGGTVLWRCKIGTAGLSGQTITFDPPLTGSPATLLEAVTLTAAGTGAVFFNAQGFVSV